MEKRAKNQKEDGRALPQYGEKNAAKKPLRVAAPTALAEPQTKAELLDVAAEILLQLATPNERLLAKQSPMALSTVAALVREFCHDIEGVQVEVPTDALPAVASCMHNVFFCIGTLIYAAVAHADAVRVTAVPTDTAGEIRIEAAVPAATLDEARACFGLSPERLFILKRIAKDGEFSFRAEAGERAAVVLTLPRAVQRRIILRANADMTLRAAFALPKIYFAN